MDSAQKQPSSWKNSLDIVVLILGLGLTFVVWKYTQRLVASQIEHKLLSQVDVIEKSVTASLTGYENALTGARGLFTASMEVEREEFNDYFKGINVSAQYPGIYSFVYVSRVMDEDLSEFKQALETEFKESKIPGKLTFELAENPEHYIVNYIAYEHEVAPVAYGLDLKLDVSRRDALEKARDTGKISASAPIILRGPEKPGFIITIPIYINGLSVETVSEKRDGLVGFVNAAFIYDELLTDIFTPINHEGIEIHIKDGGKLIYDTFSLDKHNSNGEDVSELTNLSNIKILVGNREWIMEFSVDPKMQMGGVESNLPTIVMITGVLASLLLFSIVYALSSSRARAVSLALEMTSVLKAEKDRINLIVSSMGEGLLVVDENHKISMMNPVAEKLLEITQQGAVGKNWSEIVATFKADKKVPVEERSIAQTVHERKTIVTDLADDHYYQTSSGRKFPIVSITAPLISEGKSIGAVKVFRDATHDKDAKALIEKEVSDRTLALQEEKAKFIASIESIVRAYVMIDTAGTVVMTNHKLVDFLGETEEGWSLEVLGKKLGGFDITSAFNKAKNDGKSTTVDEIQLGTHFYDLFVNPIFFDKKQIIGVLILIGDITEERILARSRDEFFSIASHELRTPLTSIRGNTAMIKDYFGKDLKDPNLREMINDIHDSSVRLIDIVNDFLNLSRLEQGKMEFKQEAFDIIELISETTAELQTIAKAKGLYVKSGSMDSGASKVVGDRNKVKEILFNLIGNAINYTAKGGVTLDLVLDKGQSSVKISDTGRGISVENQNLLFRKFQQAGTNTLTRDTTKGTGLGLYISKLLVEGMGGKIALETSEAGKGSTFSFILPIAVGDTRAIK